MKPTEITLQGGALIVDAPYHPEIVARLKGVGGEWRPASKTWAVAAERGDRLLAALPKASYSYDALCACWKASEGRAAAFAGSLVQWGIKLEIVDSGGSQAICAVGETVSPLIADLVAVSDGAESFYQTATDVYAVYAFTASGTITFPSSVTADILLVGGGGGGCADSSGGG